MGLKLNSLKLKGLKRNGSATMNNAQFESQMRQGEQFHALRLPSGAWPVLRVDGHGFSRLTQTHYEKPFDAAFHAAMIETARALLEELGGVYAYTQSDEISILLPRDWAGFNRKVEKVVSLSSGLASAVWTQFSGFRAHFDSRVWLGEEKAAVCDYFRWRQSDGARNALNGWCYWTLRNNGASVQSATQSLEGTPPDAKRLLLSQHDIDFDQTPAWQRLGAGLLWEEFEKLGLDPLTGETVSATRRRVRVEDDLPTGEPYARLIEAML